MPRYKDIVFLRPITSKQQPSHGGDLLCITISTYEYWGSSWISEGSNVKLWYWYAYP